MRFLADAVRFAKAATLLQNLKKPVECEFQTKRTKRFLSHGVVVQLVRISACHAEGRGFESRPLRHRTTPCNTKVARGFLLSALEFFSRRIFIFRFLSSFSLLFFHPPHLPRSISTAHLKTKNSRPFKSCRCLETDGKRNFQRTR